VNVLQDSENVAEINKIEPSDEFASSPPNRARLLAVRLVKWLFTPPYFPAELVWFLSALIITNIALKLVPQPAPYWIDPSTSTYYSFFGTPLRWGIWNIVTLVGYILVIASILNLLNIKPAFVLWIGLCFYHLATIPDTFRCGAVFYLPFETLNNCSTVHTFAIILAGISSGAVVWIAARTDLLSMVKSESLTIPFTPEWLRNLKRFALT